MSAVTSMTVKGLVADDPKFARYEPPPLKTALDDYVSLNIFRTAHSLPDTFGLSLFQPKDQVGLGSITHAAEALRELREAVLIAMPASGSSVVGVQTLALQLQLAFRRALLEANAHVGLKPSEVAFAVNGFGEVCRMEAYALLQARLRNEPAPVFEQIYQTWLAGTLIMTRKPYHYCHGQDTWLVYIVANAFGRYGLAVCPVSDTQTYYVCDSSLVCPAQYFMETLLRDVSARMRLMWGGA